MSRLDPKALLKSLGYATDLPDEDEIKKLDLARGESLMSKTMAARAARKSGRAQKQIDAKTNTSGIAGAIGSVLNFAGGKRDRAAGEAEELTQERLFNKSQAAMQNAAAAKAQRAEQNALGGHAQDIMLDREGNATTLEGKRITARQSDRNSIRTAQTAANTAAATKAAQELKRDDAQSVITTKFAADILPQVNIAKSRDLQIAYMNEHPDVALTSAQVADMNFKISQLGEIEAEIEAEDLDKTASTTTQKAEKHYNAVRNPVVAQADAIQSDDSSTEAERQAALAALIAENPGIEEYIGDSAMDQIARLHREADRAKREEAGEAQNRIDDNAVESASSEELNNAYNSDRKEHHRVYRINGVLGQQQGTEISGTIQGSSIDAASRTTPEQKKLHTLAMNVIMQEVVGIAATTFTDSVLSSISANNGLIPGISIEAYRDNQATQRTATLGKIENMAKGAGKKTRFDYIDRFEGGQPFGIRLLDDYTPGEPDPQGGTPKPSISGVLEGLGTSDETPIGKAKGQNNLEAMPFIGASGVGSAAKVLQQGVEQVPLIGGALNKGLDAMKQLGKSPENRNQGSMLPNARQQMQQQQTPMQQQPMSPQDERKRLLLQALAAQQQQSSSQRIV